MSLADMQGYGNRYCKRKLRYKEYRAQRGVENEAVNILRGKVRHKVIKVYSREHREGNGHVACDIAEHSSFCKHRERNNRVSREISPSEYYLKMVCRLVVDLLQPTAVYNVYDGVRHPLTEKSKCTEEHCQRLENIYARP